MFFLRFAPFVLLIHLSKDVLCGEVTTIGGTCTPGSDTCTTSPVSVCDTTTNKCLLDTDSSCADPNSEKCKTGTSCDTDSKCKLNAGGDCSSSNSGNCKSGTTCESNVCKLNPGGVCTSASGNSAHCKSGTTCNGTACKINVGQTCAGFTSDCSSGSSCDTGNICKLNAGGDCSSSNSGNCKSGTTCESNVCKLNAGGNCSGSSAAHCKSGTSCQSNVCVADNTYGGTCTITETADSCVISGGDVNAVCKESKCACKSGFTGSIGAKCSGAASLASSLVILIAAIFVKTHLE